MDGKEIPPQICTDVLFTFKKECSGFFAETMGAGGCNKHSLYRHTTLLKRILHENMKTVSHVVNRYANCPPASESIIFIDEFYRILKIDLGR